jgi:hypothetical protein
MLIPTAGVIALLWAGLVEDIGTLLAIEHVVMLPAMLIAMLLRRDEYSGHATRTRLPSSTWRFEQALRTGVRGGGQSPRTPASSPRRPAVVSVPFG